ncbi:hypothetical protein BX600DRAFT_147957 [Xylariales sp. PMI_506]|nr:hypothetical protein BX600DRAFT_147957 [Xylariales sp. PMI_506]
MVTNYRGLTIVVSMVLISSLSTLFAMGRFFVKLRIVQKTHPDDYIILASVICGWISVGFSIAAVEAGDGQHIETLSAEQISRAILWTMVGFLPGILSFSLPKVAVAILLIRLLDPGRIHRRCILALPILCIIVLMACVVILFTQCSPPKSQWDLSITERTCISPWILVNCSRAAGCISAFTDLYLSLYPSAVLYGLEMAHKKKLALSAILGIGVIATIIAIYKVTTLSSLASPDFTWATTDLTILTCAEGSAITISACIPNMQPLLERVIGRRIFNINNQPHWAQSQPEMTQELELSSSGRGLNSSVRNVCSDVNRTIMI